MRVCPTAHGALYPPHRNGDYPRGGGIPADRGVVLYRDRPAVPAVWVLPRDEPAGDVRGADGHFPGDAGGAGVPLICGSMDWRDGHLGLCAHRMAVGRFGGGFRL